MNMVAQLLDAHVARQIEGTSWTSEYIPKGILEAMRFNALVRLQRDAWAYVHRYEVRHDKDLPGCHMAYAYHMDAVEHNGYEPG